MRYRVFVVGVVVVIIVFVVVCLSWLECAERIMTLFLSITLYESPYPFYQSGFNDLALIGKSC